MAGQLIPGDRVLGHDGKSAAVERIDEDFGFRRVYNLTVSEYHTFFVGGVGWGFSVWVHNQSWCEQIAKLRDAIKSGVPEAIAKERASTKAMIASAGKDPKLADDIRKSLAGRSDIEKIIGDDARKALGGFAPTTGRRAPSPENYRGRYNAERTAQGRARLPDEYDAHHRIPQEYMDHPEFKDFDFHGPSNIQGVKGSRADVNTHQLITNEWAEFRRLNPNATRAQIKEFARGIDARYADHWFK